MKKTPDAPPIRAAALPGGGDPTGELGDPPDALIDSIETPAPPAGRALQAEFLGSAAEYARLWYVNLILGLLTLGIYSAWAKVRQRQYLAAHTLIDGVPLVYHGSPLPILFGRLLALSLLGLAWGALTLVPEAKPFVTAALILIAPWFVLSTLAFNARNHSWRGLHFAVTGSYREAARAVYPLLVWPLSSVVFWAIGQASTNLLFGYLEIWIPMVIYVLLWPRTIAAITTLKLNGLRYGNGRFVLDADARDFNALIFRSGGKRFLQFMIGAIIGVQLAGPILGPDIQGALLAVVVFVLFAAGTGLGRARRFNFALHRLCFENRLRFRSTLAPDAHARLFLRNAVLNLLTLGLAAPWCLIQVREARLKAVTLYLDGELDDILAAPKSGQHAWGEALSEGLNLDFSL